MRHYASTTGRGEEIIMVYLFCPPGKKDTREMKIIGKRKFSFHYVFALAERKTSTDYVIAAPASALSSFGNMDMKSDRRVIWKIST